MGSKQQEEKNSYEFEFNKLLEPYNVSVEEYLRVHKKKGIWLGLGTNVCVFDKNDKLLMVQRSKEEKTNPNLWEIPGGSVKGNGETILSAAARELYEETGLKVKHFHSIVSTREEAGVPADVFYSDDRKEEYCRFTFVVDVQTAHPIQLSVEEHQDHKWAAKDEVLEGKIRGTNIREVLRGLILKSFDQIPGGSLAGWN